LPEKSATFRDHARTRFSPLPVLTELNVRSAPVLENDAIRLSLTNFLTGFTLGFTG
jgi:hypothetical protein